MAIKGNEEFQAMQARLADLLPRLMNAIAAWRWQLKRNRGGVVESVLCIKPLVRHRRRFGVA